MSVKSWTYAQFEGIKQAKEKLGGTFVITGQSAKPDGSGPNVVASSGMPTIDLEATFGANSTDAYYAGIDEVWYCAAALGSALVGCRAYDHTAMPMANTYEFELITQHAAKMRSMTGGQATVPAVFRVRNSGPREGRGAQHNDFEADAWYAHAAGLKVVTPSTVHDAKGLMTAAFASGDPVVYMDRTVVSSGECPDEYFEVPIGKAELRMEGNDLTIVGSGSSMPVVLGAAERLKAEGIGVDAIDLRTLKPMDTETLVKSVQKTGNLLTVDYGKYTLGIGAEVVARVAEGVPGAKFKRIAQPDVPPPAAVEFVYWLYPDVDNVYDAAKLLLYDPAVADSEGK
jgi:pyruvate dehydrogenase E1 component beta subunit